MIQLELEFPTCQIQWIDKLGKPTPDNNYSIGITTCNSAVFGPKSFHICKEHAKRMVRECHSWSFRPIK